MMSINARISSLREAFSRAQARVDMMGEFALAEDLASAEHFWTALKLAELARRVGARPLHR